MCARERKRERPWVQWEELMLQHSGRESKANCESDSLILSLFGPYLPPSTSTLPFSSLSQHLSSCLHLCRAHFRWQEGGRKRGGREWWREGGGGGWKEEHWGRETKGCTMIAQRFKSCWRGTFQPRWGCFPHLPTSSSSRSKNPRCYTSKRRRLTARHSNLCNRTVF